MQIEKHKFQQLTKFLINFIVTSNINQKNRAFLKDKLKRNAIRIIDGDAMQSVKLAAKRMKTQSRMNRINLKKLQSFSVSVP